MPGRQPRISSPLPTLLLPLLAGLLAAQEVSGPTPEGPPKVNPWLSSADPLRPALLYDRFETIDSSDGLPSDRVTSVLVEEDLMAVGTDHGLAVRKGDGWEVYGPEQGLSHRYVTSISQDSTTGDLWISTLRGLNRLSAGRIKVYTQLDSGLMNNVVYHVLVEPPLVWAATAAGTSCLDTRTGSWVIYSQENTIMHEPWSYSLAVGPERTWVGIWGGGVVELDRQTGLWKEYRDPDKEMELDLIRDDGPIHDVTAFIAYEDGVLWQATYFGLSRYDGRRWRSWRDTDSGLPGNFISHVSARGHTAFLGTDQGLGVFDGETMVSYKRTDEGTCEVRVFRDGKEVESRVLPTAPADNYILWTIGGDSDVWLATGAGLSHGVIDSK